MFDEGSSQRVRVSKDSARVEALGAIDELNSFLGICKSSSENASMIRIIEAIQRNLLTIGSITAGSKLRFSKVQTKKLEKLIDNLEGKLPVLRNFVVPGGSTSATQLQYARSLARRAERRMVSLSKFEEVRPQILEYLNRLSDILFMLAREQNNNVGIKDEVWIGNKVK
jgi:cob(I)alamin adenosyltransferase